MNNVALWKRSLAFFLNIMLAVGVVGAVHVASEPDSAPGLLAAKNGDGDEVQAPQMTCRSATFDSAMPNKQRVRLSVSGARERDVPVVEIQLVCGSSAAAGFKGQIGGGNIAIPKSSKSTGGAYSPKFGKPAKEDDKVLGKAKKVKKKFSEKKLRKFIKSQKVPLPPKDNKMPKTAPYSVYQIYAKNIGSKPYRLYKFGITRAGKKRPGRQVTKCVEYYESLGYVDPQCGWQWVRGDIIGWYRARLHEGLHTARYKKVHDKFPPGMPQGK